MDKPSLKQRTLNSIAWASSIQFVSQIINFCLGLILARLLSPEHFGLVAMVLVFVGISQIFSDLGLSASLIQKDKVSVEEAFSCLVVNMLIGLFLSLVLALSSQLIANFYHERSLVVIVIAIAPVFLINSLSSVPTALLSRELRYKALSLIEFFSVIFSSIAAVFLAVYGYGVWSLVIQQILQATIKTLLLLYFSRIKWRRFDLSLVKPLLNFSLNVFLTRIVQQVTQQTDKILIGKYIGPLQLGLYSRAFYITSFPVQRISQVVGNVMFPALSKIKGDKAKVSDIYIRLIGIVSVITFPLLAGLAYLSEEVISLLLGDKWLPMKNYFVVFCLTNMLASIGQMSAPFYLSQGRSDIHLKLNLFTQPVKIILLLFGVKWGVDGVLIAYVTSTLISFTSAIASLSYVLKLSLFRITWVLSRQAVVTFLMLLILEAFNRFYIIKYEFLYLLINFIVGGIFYFFVNKFFKIEPYLEIESLVLSKLYKK